jgi:protein-S-isoprenylcysteine O-methyltransferase Ste14
MNDLELKVPPPVVALLVAAAMWGGSLLAPSVGVSACVRVGAAIAIALAGVAIAVSGAVAFRRAGTTVNPMQPEATSSLVSSGIYRLTRNPMYAGLALVLVAWAIFLSSAWALLGPVFFVFYITRFQIRPEERALAKIFGAAYLDYRARVRRWY